MKNNIKKLKQMMTLLKKINKNKLKKKDFLPNL